MKRIVFSIALCVLVGLILVPVTGSVNHPRVQLSVSGTLLQADGGAPLPPPPPGRSMSGKVLLADGGAPLPPPPPFKAPLVESAA